MSGVNYYLSSNGTSIWHNSAADFLSFGKNFHRKFAILVAPSTDGTTKCLVHCKEHIVLQQMAETAPKSIHKLKCYEIDENVRFGIWRYALVLSDAGQKNRSVGVQLTVLPVHNSPQNIFETYFLYDF